MLPTIGKIRGMQQCASKRGTFTCLALDHRQNLRRALNPQDPTTVPDSALTDFKLEVTAALAGDATAVLLDPEYSAAQAVAAGVIPKNVGLVVAVEATGYTGDPNARQSRILPGWSVEKAKRMGASMIKLLVYYHPDATTASKIEEFTQWVADDCKKYDLGIMLEPLSYPLDPNEVKLASDEKRYVVVETASKLTPLGVDVLKAEFPLDTSNTDEISLEHGLYRSLISIRSSLDFTLRCGRFRDLFSPGLGGMQCRGIWNCGWASGLEGSCSNGL